MSQEGIDAERKVNSHARFHARVRCYATQSLSNRDESGAGLFEVRFPEVHFRSRRHGLNAPLELIEVGPFGKYNVQNNTFTGLYMLSREFKRNTRYRLDEEGA